MSRPKISALRDQSTSLSSVLVGPEDRRAFDRLAQSLRSREHAPAGFVGAGMSQALGYPSWPKLLDGLHNMAFSSMDKERHRLSRHFNQLRACDDVTWRAQEYRDAIARDRDYLKYLKQSFRPKGKHSAALDSLVTLPFRHIFTTNYDCELELAYLRSKGRTIATVDWLEGDQSAELVSTWSDPSVEMKLIYLHGRYDEPKGIVLTESDYQRAYLKASGNAQRLSSILLLHPVLFVGFSLSDPDFMAILRQVNALGFSGARHFALIGLSTSQDEQARFLNRARLRRKYGVAAIFFRPGENYDGLRVLLERLHQSREKSPLPPASLPTQKVDEKYVWGRNKKYPHDPVKGRFGGLAERGPWKLSATVMRDPDDSYWFHVQFKVSLRPGFRGRLHRRVDFFVHDTFPQYRYWSFPRKNEAKCTRGCYGSFTVGALVHQDRTYLELDLAEIDGVPLDFQMT